MPAAPQPSVFADDVSPADAAAAWHKELFGMAPHQQAEAPATWPVIGEHVDHAGGVVIMSVASQRAAVAVSPREDQKFQIHFRRTELADGSTDCSTFDEIAELFSQQQPEVDETGKPTTPPLPRGGLAQRLGGIVWMMIQRQLLSRETSGMNIVVVSAISPDSGLGEYAAIDTALALALQAEAPDVDEAPLRARLAEVCAQAGELFSGTATLRARYSAALRGSGTQVAVIDYADGSLTSAVHPVNRDLAAFAVAVPPIPQRAGKNEAQSADTPAACPDQSDEIRTRNRFVDAARQAFGAQSLRLLPDAPARVTQWLAAVHQVHGAAGYPELHESQTWLEFHAAETERVQRFAHALRSQRARDIWALLQESQRALQADYGLVAADELAQLCQARGAIGARAAAAGTSNAVIAYVDKKKAANFSSDLSADGLVVTQLLPGKIAKVL